MEYSLFQKLKLHILDVTGLEKDALHIYVALGVFLGAALLLRRSLGSWLPLLAVLLVACAGELLDLRDDLRFYHAWQWRSSLHDVVNTLFWPLVLFLLARYTRVLKR